MNSDKVSWSHLQVIKHAQLSNQDTGIIPAIARVLAWSQKYMRERKVSNRYIMGTNGLPGHELLISCMRMQPTCSTLSRVMYPVDHDQS